MIIAVIGATSRTGRHVLRRLAATGHDVVAVGRNPRLLAELEVPVTRAVADLDQPATVAAAIAPARRVLTLAHARHTGKVLAALPDGCERLVLTGSTRKDTTLPDPAAEEVRAAEAEFLGSGVPGIMLHPSMIYGARDDRNVSRVLAFVRRWPARLPLVVPLPGRGRHTVQPVFVDDVVEAMVAALLRPDVTGPPLPVVGPEPITYAELVATCAAALGRTAHVVPAPPERLLRVASRLARLPVSVEELLRSAEDKRYDPAPLAERLGVTPRPFADGLRLKLAREAGDYG